MELAFFRSAEKIKIPTYDGILISYKMKTNNGVK